MRTCKHVEWRGVLLLCGLALAVPFTLHATDVRANEAAADQEFLTVIGEAGEPQEVSAAEFAKLPRSKVTVKLDDQDVEFEGVGFVELLRSLGVAYEQEIRGGGVPTVAVLEAKDGYRMVLSLLEVDPKTTDVKAIVADMRDGQPLTGDEAPLRLILPGDKRHARWIRMVRTIRVLNLKEVPLRADASDVASPAK